MKCISDMPEFIDKSHVMTFEETTTVYKAVCEMAKKNYGAVLVTREGKLAGIFTERDLLRRVVAENMDTKKKTLKDVMSTNLKTAKTSDQIADCLRRMSQGRFRHLPVVDDQGNLEGMLSQGDFVAYTMSDVLTRAGTVARAGIDAGNSTPFSIMLAVLIYTLSLLFVVSGLGYWFGGR